MKTFPKNSENSSGRIKEYQTVRDVDVDTYLRGGWVLYGSPVIAVDENITYIWQAIVKYENS